LKSETHFVRLEAKEFPTQDRKMKRAQIGMIVVGLLLLSLGLQAVESNVRFGLKGSLNISRHWSAEELSGKGHSVSSANRTTFALGALVSWRLSRRFHLQPEIYYIKKGSHQNVKVDGLPIGPIKATYSLGYIEIPVLLKAYLKGDRELLGTHVVAGPYLSLLADDSYTLKNSFLGESESGISGLRSTDYGLIIGLGLDVNGLDARFVFDYRFSLGLADLTLPTGPTLPTLEMRNQCHMFVLEVIL
jgi:hypothetical protein